MDRQLLMCASGGIFGSLDLVGSPVGLVRRVGIGLSEAVLLPYHGLSQSPSAFVHGLIVGTSSLLTNVLTGTHIPCGVMWRMCVGFSDVACT